MPWKLIIFLICLILATVFVGFNLDYTSSINVLFTTFTEVPVSIIVLSSVTFGVFIAAIFMFGMKMSKKSKKTQKQEVSVAQTQKNTAQSMHYSYGENTTVQRKTPKSDVSKVEKNEKSIPVDTVDV